jgi:hydantoinase/carbamoylase family amidase
MSALADDLEAVSRFGGDGTSVTRFAWSHELAAAYDWLAGRLRELGIESEVDPAGNLIGRWQSGSGKPIAVGSHLDSVPRGGRFDGTLGVLSGLHAIRLLKERGVEPQRPIWLISFNDEDGGRFGTGLFGSRAFVGRDLTELADRTDAEGTTIRDAMKAAGFDFDRLPAAHRVDELGGYLELHVEQGPVLEHEGLDVGVVTSIVGLRGFRARLTGEANHAGTTPMRMRRDAFAGAARVALALRDAALARGDMTANVGIVQVEPGGFNIIPAACEFTIDVRSGTEDGYAQLEPLVRGALDEAANEGNLDVQLTELFRLDPLPLDPQLVDAVERAAADEGASHVRMPSGAGHDAMEVGRHVPAAMLFVPSRAGISHSPDEWTSPEHCERGARVLARTLELLVG